MLVPDVAFVWVFEIVKPVVVTAFAVVAPDCEIFNIDCVVPVDNADVDVSDSAFDATSEFHVHVC